MNRNYDTAAGRARQRRRRECRHKLAQIVRVDGDRVTVRVRLRKGKDWGVVS